MTRVRLGLGGAEEVPRRLKEVEETLNGNPISEENIRAASEIAASVVTPLEDAQVPADYRRHIVKTAVRRALEAARGPGNER